MSRASPSFLQWTALCAGLALTGCASSAVVLRGNVVTLDERMPRAEALAISRGRVVAVGTLGAVREAARRTAARVTEEDLSRFTIVPGLGDAHGHLLSLGNRLHDLNVARATSFDDLVSLVAAAARARPANEWIVGRGWDQTRWTSREFPTHEALSRAVPDHPVVLQRVDGHASFVNARALALRGVHATTPDPPGGRILRDATGAPTGVLIDKAKELVSPPKPRGAQLVARLRSALRRCAEVGLTMVHDMGTDAPTLAGLRALEGRAELPLRVVVYKWAPDARALGEVLRSHPDVGPPAEDWRIIVRGVKLVVDGAMGSRGAALLEPYADEAAQRGLLLWSREALRGAIARIAGRGFQPAIHAIGDDAVHEVLSAFGRLTPGALPPRVEHLQLLSPDAPDRLRALAARGVVVASMQPAHLASDMRWVLERLGPTRAERTYAWRTAAATGALLAFGSDFPVEDPSPIFGLHAASERGDVAGRAAPFGGRERIDRLTALRAFTRGVARAAGLRRHGRIVPGAVADLTVLDRDVLTASPSDLLKTRAVRTYVHGREAWRWQP